MGKIYCLMGKSSSGKDSIYRELLQRGLSLETIVPYTTRPIREGEFPGETYVFCDENEVRRLSDEGRIIELRAYQTVFGIWKYFTVDDGQIDLENRSYLYIVTLGGYVRMREYFGTHRVVPLYIEVEDGERLMRAIARERQQQVPQYEEMCRRFLADAVDFSEERLREAGVTARFVNENFEETVCRVGGYIRAEEQGQTARAVYESQ